MNSKVNQIKAGLKAEMQKIKIGNLSEAIRAAVAQDQTRKGKGKTILEAIGSELSQSGGLYKDCKNSGEAASILLAQLERILGGDIQSGQHQLVYKNDNLLLISIDKVFYEITGSELKSSIIKMARNAGVPIMFVGTQLAKLLIDGLIAFWKKYDSTYSDKNRLLE